MSSSLVVIVLSKHGSRHLLSIFVIVTRFKIGMACQATNDTTESSLARSFYRLAKSVVVILRARSTPLSRSMVRTAFLKKLEREVSQLWHY
jgi:hypothetical protein